MLYVKDIWIFQWESSKYIIVFFVIVDGSDTPCKSDEDYNIQGDWCTT